MNLDALLLARIQFALTIGFHFLFPPTSIGLAWVLTYIEWRGWRKDDRDYTRMGKFFAKILALTFAMGVATGIVMEFQFGMNWARYSTFVGDIFGAPLAAEGVFAFFLESTFLGLYLFGRDKVSKGVHWFSCLMVAVGATISAFWILVANSWQQTPAGYEAIVKLADGSTTRMFVPASEKLIVPEGAVIVKAQLTSFFEAVFNPSTIPRFLHQTNSCLIVGGFLVAGVAAYLLLKNKEDQAARKMVRMGIVIALVSSLIALFITGDMHAKNVAKHQPAKLAAMEGLEKTQKRAPLLIFGIPHKGGVDHEVMLPIPGMLSFLAYSDFDAEVKGLEAFPEDERPPVIAVFTAFHLMVGIGSYLILLGIVGTFMVWRKTLWHSPKVLWILVATIPLPILGQQVGWMTAEVGRQPWIVYGLLRTCDAHSTVVKGGEILTSIILFGFVYLLLGSLYVFLMVRKIKQGPPPPDLDDAASSKEVAA